MTPEGGSTQRLNLAETRYHLLVAHGAADGGDGLEYHSDRRASAQPVALATADDRAAPMPDDYEKCKGRIRSVREIVGYTRKQ